VQDLKNVVCGRELNRPHVDALRIRYLRTSLVQLKKKRRHWFTSPAYMWRDLGPLLAKNFQITTTKRNFIISHVNIFYIRKQNYRLGVSLNCAPKKIATVFYNKVEPEKFVA